MKKTNFKINKEDFNVWYLKGPKNSPVLHWAHGNGLNGRTYENLLKNLSKFFHIYAWDARSHGLNHRIKRPAEANTYGQYVSDFKNLIELLYEKHSMPIVIAGHSFGATICIKAEPELRGKVSKLVLADPVLFTPLANGVSQLLRFFKSKKPKNIYLAQNAAKRRDKWSTKAEAHLDLSKKNLFKNWDKLSFENYINYGTFDIGEGISLSCPRAIEALIFKKSESEFLRNTIINLSVETHLYLASRGSPSFDKNSFFKSKKLKTFKILPSSNHLFPIEEYGNFSKAIVQHLIPAETKNLNHI